MKNNRPKFYVENLEYFDSIMVKGSVNYKFVWRNILTGNYDIDGEYVMVKYDDEGWCQFEIINETPNWLTLEFISTIK